MRRSRRMLSLISLLSLLVLSTGAMALDDTSPKPFAPVQGGYVDSAEQVLPYAPNRILVQLRDINLNKSNVLAVGLDKGSRFPNNLTGISSIDALCADAGVVSIERPYTRSLTPAKSSALGKDRWFMFRFADGADIASLAEDFRRDPNVEAASLDWLAFPAAVPSDPMYTDNWGHNNTAQLPDLDWGGTYEHDLPTTVGTVGFDSNIPGAWDQGYGASSVVIAILDSGVAAGHPDLRQVAGYDFGDNDSNPDDDSGNPGHGTACAGVAAAINNGMGAVGVAGGCSIMPCKVANSAGSMYFSAIQDALYWAADNGADIISMSLGAPGVSTDAATDAALAYAYNAGVTLFAATGNENDSAIGYPAINANVIAVGAASPCGDRKRSSSLSTEVNPGNYTDPNGYTCDGERWWGSNYGTTTPDARTSVDILGPTILPTTDILGSGGYDPGDYSSFFNGTSCATPYVAGVGALVKSLNPSYTPAQIRDALVSTAQDIVNVESGNGFDRYSGYGMVDAEAAVGGGTPQPPVADFSGAPVSGTFPLNVTFTDQSAGSPTSWSWTFGDGGTSTAQNPSYTYTAAGTYNVSLTVSNAEGSDTLTRTGYITVTEPGVTTFVTADGETSVTGTVTGSYLATKVNDGASEVITEVAYTGHPRKTYSYAEHTWSFNLPAGGDATFHLVASRTANGENDNFAFTYSTDGVNFNALATVTSATAQSFSVPLGVLSGTVTVRAVDTDRNWGNTGLDALSVDYLAFEMGDVQPVAPTADFTGTPTSGEYPLAVQFTDASSGDPTSWSWTFGDGGTSTAQNPSHTYNAAGTYNVSLTATNAQGSDTITKNGFITVTEPGVGGTTLFVQSMTVTTGRSGPNTLASCVVVIHDDAGQPVSGATVTASFDGPTNGTDSGTTAADGSVTLQSTGFKKPTIEWCFEVTNVTHATLNYDAASNVTTRSCESGDVFGADGTRVLPRTFGLAQNHPNPFNPMTNISFDLPRDSNVVLTVFNLRGQAVTTLVNQSLSAGHHTVTWDARSHPSGVYFYRIEAPGFTETRKMIMLK